MYIMYINKVMHTSATSSMPKPHSVKARFRQGTESLDLTIPAELKREHGITGGDVFIVEIRDGSNDLTISYKRVHQAKS